MNLSGFDLNLLKVLDALLRDHSTKLAGQRVGLSQPAVSSALGRLRHALGDPLFVRHGQRLVPTEFARTLEFPVRAILDQTETLFAGPSRFDPATSTLPFRISGSDFFSEMLMPALARHIGNVAPGVRVQLIDLVPQDYLGRVETYDADVALVPNMELPSWAHHERLFASPFVAIARHAHPRLSKAGLRTGDTIPLDLFCDLGHVLFSVEGKLTGMGDAALERVGRKRRVIMTMPVFSGVARAVAGSDLIAIIPLQLAQRLAPDLGLDIFVAPMPLPSPAIHMVWHRRHEQDAFHAWMRSAIFDLLGPLDGAVIGAQANPAINQNI